MRLNPPAATGLSHDSREALPARSSRFFPCVVFPRSYRERCWMTCTAAACLSPRHIASASGCSPAEQQRLDPRCRRTMLTRVRSAVASFMGGMMSGGSNGEHGGGSDMPLKYPYTRPEFLGLSPDEVECSADHIARPILILKETKRLPWATGYAE